MGGIGKRFLYYGVGRCSWAGAPLINGVLKRGVGGGRSGRCGGGYVCVVELECMECMECMPGRLG